MDDRTLLREYAGQGSDAAFAELVNRHADLVYSAALRQTGGETHQAEEITQLVFLALARKARSLSAGVVLAGWLINATRRESANAHRRRFRRERREKLAAAMNQSSDPNPLDPAWSRIAPILDDSLARLRQPDRDAVVLHYFRRMTFREVGDALGLSEDAARKRVSRALEELRSFFIRHGVVFPAATIGLTLNSFAVQAAPAGLAIGATKVALTAASASAAGLFTSFLETLIMTKAKTALIAAVGVAAVSTPLVIQQQSLNQLRRENVALQVQTAQLDELRAENKSLSNASAQARTSNALPQDQLMDLLRLRSEVGQLRRQTNELAALRRETEQLRANMAAGAPRAAMAQSTPPGSNDVASANAVIFDPTAPVTAKLAALRILRSANARTDGVVKQMLQAFHASDNPDVRADIFRNLSRMTTPELKTPLLQAVSNSNEHPNVRQEAAENMAGFLPDPDVKAWLETLAFSEPDPEVRLAARRSIESYQRYLQRGR